MNREAIQSILTRARPESPEAADPEVVEARRQAQDNPALSVWLERHDAFQQVVRDSFRQLPVPSNLADQIVVRYKVVPLWQRSTHLWRIAALFAVMLTGLCLFLFAHFREHPPGFANFRNRMVRMVLRQYRMDIVTPDDAKIRSFLASKGAPADYQLPPNLQAMRRFGAGRLSWQGHPVSMVCLKNPADETLFLFVLDAGSVRKPPPKGTWQLAQVNKLTTASWSAGNRSYLLAAPGDVRPYLGPP